ncbi:hypothetical protein E2I00_017117, partial [Balaenoptera physalus]
PGSSAQTQAPHCSMDTPSPDPWPSPLPGEEEKPLALPPPVPRGRRGRRPALLPGVPSGLPLPLRPGAPQHLTLRAEAARVQGLRQDLQACPVCRLRFTEANTLRRHAKRKHPEAMEAPLGPRESGPEPPWDDEGIPATAGADEEELEGKEVA